jgi:hypothetical protein
MTRGPPTIHSIKKYQVQRGHQRLSTDQARRAIVRERKEAAEPTRTSEAAILAELQRSGILPPVADSPMARRLAKHKGRLGQ